MTTIGSLFSGAGMLDLAAAAHFDATVVWHVESDPHASKVLAHRLPGTPNLGDVTRIDWAAVEPVDILTAGFPCVDLSYAGRGAGIREGTRSGLWSYFADAARVLRPRYVVIENVGALVTRRPGLDVVLADLARIGFDAEWVCLPAADVGAPHRRDRWFAVAHPDGAGREGRAALRRRPHQRTAGPDRLDAPTDVDWGVYRPAVHRWAAIIGRPAPDPVDRRGRLSPPFVEWMLGLPAGWVTDVPGIPRTQQLKILGNGVVPQQAAAALRILAPAPAGVPA